MTVQKKALGRAGTAEMTLRPKTKSATADELVGTVLDKHFPTPATSSSIAGGGRASRKLTPMDAATVTKRLSVGSTESSATHSMSSGVPVAHPNSARTKGVLPPTAPKSRRSRPCPVKRRASADEVYGLDTRSLASLWRTRGGSEEDLATKDNESEGEDELPMTKAVSDMPRSEAIKILPPSTALTVDPDKLAQQKQIVEFILSDDLPGATSSIAVSATQSGHSTGMSVEQEKSLARRRRSFELQALIIEGEVTEKTQMEVSGIQTVDVQDTALIKSREEKYWQNMWHMAKSARNDEKDVEDGDDPFELEGVEIGLVHPY